MKRLFGTDGIRGLAGSPPLEPPTVRRFGAALAHVLAEDAGRPCRLVLGRDTRESGPWLADAVACGLAAAGAESVGVGVVTTPGLARIVQDGGFDAGVMISASHNPFRDNGLKVFGRGGVKLADAVEARVEDAILGTALADPPQRTVTTEPDGKLISAYESYLESQLPEGRLRGTKLLLDCANGSACEIAPRVFRHYGAEVRVIGDRPDGRNINLDCGSLHLGPLARRVAEEGYDLGIAFDGDADRALAVDRRGRVIDGDHLLYLGARRLLRRGALRGEAVVATIMSNLWLELKLREEGIKLHRAPVGDKYVLARMIETDSVLGGEQSGHVIFRDRAQTGDGILTGLLFVDAVLAEPEALESILDGIVPCPQVLLSVRVREKPNLRDHPAIGPVVSEVEASLGESGRIVLRYSGTEPVARVMVEGRDRDAVQLHARRLAQVVEEHLAG